MDVAVSAGGAGGVLCAGGSGAKGASDLARAESETGLWAPGVAQEVRRPREERADRLQRKREKTRGFMGIGSGLNRWAVECGRWVGIGVWCGGPGRNPVATRL